MKIRQHYIHKATKNAVTALNMAQQVSDKEGIPSYKYEVQELVYIINTVSLALQRVCESIETKFNMENEDE